MDKHNEIYIKTQGSLHTLNNNKVHSFVGDLDYAIEIFKFHFNDKKINAHNDYMRWKKVCDTLEELYPGEDDDE